MQKFSNSSIVKLIALLLTLLLIAKFISLAIWYILPNEGVELQANSAHQMKYQRVDFKNMLPSSEVSQGAAQGVSTATDIRNLLLRGLYGTKTDGYAIVAKKVAPAKTSIITVGESYAGYKLKEIHLDYVVFIKASREYRLRLENAKNNNISPMVQKVTHKVDETTVYRKDIENYAKNFTQIWKDISIVPVKTNGKIEGFQVTRIRPNSKMAELGLKKGDIIIKANNVELTSYNAAIKLYKNIASVDTIELVVKRDNQEKEIIYEIR
ncbi:PDZ domain-containing protein [Sulfurimonas sp.]